MSVRADLGYLPQDFGFYPNLTGEQMLIYLLAVEGSRLTLQSEEARGRVARKSEPRLRGEAESEEGIRAECSSGSVSLRRSRATRS